MIKMGELTVLNKRESKGILKALKEQWGFTTKLEYVFLVSQKDKVYITNKDVFDLDLKKFKIDTLGLYFGRLVPKGLRLSIEGSQIIGPGASKNVLELSDAEFKPWLAGEDVIIDENVDAFYILKNKGLYVGCGYVKDGTLLNYIPKNRRLT